MYKKILTLFLIILFGVNIQTFAAEQVEYKTASKFAQVTTNMLGYNFVAKHVAQSVIRRTLNKSVKGKYKVKISSFSGIDLKKGIFKGLTIDGTDLSLDDELFFSKMHIETTSDFNYVDYRKSPMEFKTDLKMNYVVELTEDDLNKCMDKTTLFDELSSFIPLVSIQKFKFCIDNENIKIFSGIRFPFGKTIKISMTTSPKVINGKAVLEEVNPNDKNANVTRKILELMNSCNLFNDINLNMLVGNPVKMTIQNIVVKDKKICINGTLMIKKVN